MSEVDTQIGAAVRCHRKAHGRSQKWLGDQLGVTFQQIAKMESGASRIFASSLVQIGKALGVDPAVFFEAEGPQE